MAIRFKRDSKFASLTTWLAALQHGSSRLSKISIKSTSHIVARLLPPASVVLRQPLTECLESVSSENCKGVDYFLELATEWAEMNDLIMAQVHFYPSPR